MTYKELISICNPIRLFGPEPRSIGALHQDSRQLKSNDVFIAIRGYEADGHDYIQEAVDKGASVIIREENDRLDDRSDEVHRPGGSADAERGRTGDSADMDPQQRNGSEDEKWANKRGVSVLYVKSTRPLLGKLAQAFHGNPAGKLVTLAVTGTNGKTTVATLVWQVLQKLGVKSGLLGTVTKQFGDQQEPSRLTTADPLEIAADLKKMTDLGCTTVAMEVSSHALEQERTTGIEWDIAAYTNLSHDHLDYHKDMNSYIAAKKRLFDSLDSSAVAVVNMDDFNGPEMIRDCRAGIVDFAFQKRASVPCRLLRSGEAGLQITVDGVEIQTPLTGTFNAYNVAEAFLICRALDLDESRIVNALKTCSGAPGRLEKVNTPGEIGGKPTLFVDYAHTPDALANVAVALKEVKKRDQPLIILFGCGGDRDAAKRPLMAEIAEAHADQIIVTSDNPRTETPESIIRDIEEGFSGTAQWTSIASRDQAIRQAILDAPANAIILIAGKGHETYQEVHGRRHHFDDREVARKALDEYDEAIKRVEDS